MPTFIDRTVDALYARFIETPQGRAIADQALRAEAEERRQRRTAVLAEDKELEARELTLIRAREARRREEVADLDRAKAVVAAKEQAITRAECEHREQVAPIVRRRDRIAAELHESRPVETLNAFVAEMETALEQTHKSGDSVRERFIDGRVRVTWSNRDSLLCRSEAIMGAIRQARDLAAKAIDDAALVPQFDALRAALPALEERPARFRDGGDDAA